MRPALTLALAALAASAAAQDVVRLRNGRVLAGEIAVKDPAAGFSITLWETGGTLEVPWELITEDEKRRLTRAEPVVSGPQVEAVIVMTRTGDYHRGVFVKEEKGTLHLKERGKPQPVPVLVSMIETRKTEMLPESTLYTDAEILKLRSDKADPANPEQQHVLAVTAAGWKLYEEAAGFYAAAAAALGKKAKDDPRIAEWEGQGKEMKARVLRVSVDAALKKLDYAAAKKAADEIQAKYAETPTGDAAKDLAQFIDAEKAAFEADRDKLMLAKVVEAWPGERNNQLSRVVTGSKNDIQAAIAKVPEVDKLIAEALAKEFKEAKATPEEINGWWQRRGETVPAPDPAGKGKKLRRYTAAYGAGTWIVRGGQDGGSDFVEFTDAQATSKATGKATGKQGAGRTGGKQGANQGQPQPEDKELQTSSGWWEDQSFNIKRQWLEAYYAENSQMVTVEEVKVTGVCTTCGGTGVRSATRATRKCTIKCYRCHQHTGVDSRKRVVELSVVHY